MVLETQIKAFQNYGRGFVIRPRKQLISFSIVLSVLPVFLLFHLAVLMISTRFSAQVKVYCFLFWKLRAVMYFDLGLRRCAPEIFKKLWVDLPKKFGLIRHVALSPRLSHSKGGCEHD